MIRAPTKMRNNRISLPPRITARNGPNRFSSRRGDQILRMMDKDADGSTADGAVARFSFQNTGITDIRRSVDGIVDIWEVARTVAPVSEEPTMAALA